LGDWKTFSQLDFPCNQWLRKFKERQSLKKSLYFTSLQTQGTFRQGHRYRNRKNPVQSILHREH
jgi:hypothetical protein